MKLLNADLLRMELRRDFKGLLTWTLALALSMYVVILIYPMVIDMYAAIPPEFYPMMEAFGGIPDTVVEYYATEGGMMLQLFGAIFAALAGFGAINRDERERTAESLYVLPIRRTAFFVTKITRVSLEVLFFILVNAVASYLGFLSVAETIDYRSFLLFTGLNGVVLLMFAWLCFAMACLMKPNAKQMSAIAIPFVLYVISVISLLTSDDGILGYLKYTTPFTFSDPVEILKADFRFEWISFTVYMSLTVIATIAAWRAFQKREFAF